MIEIKDMLNQALPIFLTVIGYLLHRTISQIDSEVKALKSAQIRLMEATIRLENSFEKFQEIMKTMADIQKNEIETIKLHIFGGKIIDLNNLKEQRKKRE